MSSPSARSITKPHPHRASLTTSDIFLDRCSAPEHERKACGIREGRGVRCLVAPYFSDHRKATRLWCQRLCPEIWFYQRASRPSKTTNRRHGERFFLSPPRVRWLVDAQWRPDTPRSQAYRVVAAAGHDEPSVTLKLPQCCTLPASKRGRGALIGADLLGM